MKYIPAPSSLFVDNRRRFAAKLPAGAIAIFNSNDVMPTNADGTMGFKQQTDLFYLCGIDQEESILVIFPSARDAARRECLFVRETSEHLRIWDGEKLTKEQASALSGIQSVFWLGDFDRVVRELMNEATDVYLNRNEHLRSESSVQTRDVRFAEQFRRQYPLHQYHRAFPLVRDLRMVKSEAEIAALREATRITDLGFRRLLGFVRPGVMEYQVQAELSHEYMWHGSNGFAFPPIIASGANACVLHYVTNDKPCNDGDLLLLDTAAEYGNYNSDTTRAIPVSGRFSPRQRAVYDAVLRVMRACFKLIRPGILLADYQKEAAKVMEEELIGLGLLKREDVARQDPKAPLYRRYFMHGMSHHLGLDVHDVADTSIPLAPGNVLTVEPGIYIREEGIGIRLENICVIRENGNEDLCAGMPIEADEIEALMAAGRMKR